ncbi:MAG: Uncharacterized protein Athens101410_299 [Parcubacteria group bacterium Athens1014_10]|nr:MAG: Uncharacterized protein Athens101410_299 [Parcubacteria group bacterium Athens1014_10]TSD05983.1 MAG: Uncharacterized protein Athens071412_130 [Parcubacteria group bacterium Athens0714_12]
MSPLFVFSKKNTKKHYYPAKKGFLKNLNLKHKMSAFLFITVFLLAITYLFQINDLAIKGFEIKSLEDKINDIEQKNKNLEMNVTELQSLSNIEKLKKELNMVKAGQVDYISSSVSVTARR